MQLLDLTLPTPQENLALDEALLEEAEASAAPIETLRFWESSRPLVVVGRGSRVEGEVDAEQCARLDIPILRRTSGGGAIVAAPGCLMYAVILSYEQRPELRSLDDAHRFVLETALERLRRLVPGAARQGTSDLTIGDSKFSGNSMRCKRRGFLYHGTLLYDLDLTLVAQCLRMPPRQPEYRKGRAHQAFVANLALSGDALKRVLSEAWGARRARLEWPRQRVQSLVAQKYDRRDWNRQL
jgi:lipoate---protein ligase